MGPPADSPSDTRRTLPCWPDGGGALGSGAGIGRVPYSASSSLSSRRPISGTTTATRAATGATPGIDMENPWRAPVVAVQDGRIEYWESGLGGWCFYHYGASGTTYLYIHLNNDLTPRNDNKGACVEGRRVRRSGQREGDWRQQIAWNGDSGDASGNPHLPLRGAPARRRGRRRSITHLRRATEAALRRQGSGLQPRPSWLAASRPEQVPRWPAPGRPGPPVPRWAVATRSIRVSWRL